MQGMQVVSSLIELDFRWTEPYETQNNIFSRNMNINNLLSKRISRERKPKG